MRCRERHVAEERRPGVESRSDPRNRVLADGVGVVEIRGVGTDEGLAVHQRVRIPERTGTVQRAKEVVEPPLRRRWPTRFASAPGVGALSVVGVADMPLAGQEGSVARALENLGYGHATLVQVALVGLRGPGKRRGHPTNARLMRVETRQEGRARWAAARRVVHLRIAQAVAAERVECRRADLGAEAADVGEAHVVCEDEQDVRLGHGGLVCLTTAHLYSGFRRMRPCATSIAGREARVPTSRGDRARGR